MNRQTKIAAAILSVLLVLTVVFLFLNRPSSEGKQALAKDQKFKITVGDAVKEVTLQDIEAIGAVDISANYKPSGKTPTTRVYQGVAFADLLEYLEVDAEDILAKNTSVVFTAIDGYTTAISVADALDTEKCAIVISLEGEALGDKTSGGTGPYMMILPKEQFSQQWCKFLAEVSFK